MSDQSMREIDLQPMLIGNTIKLRPLKEDDFEELYLAASDPGIWELHPDSERYKRDVFARRFFAGALDSRGALVIEEITTDRIIGSSRSHSCITNWKRHSSSPEKIGLGARKCATHSTAI